MSCFDRMTAAFAYQVGKKSLLPVITMWPGIVRTERMVLGRRQFAGWLTDPETTNFTGRACVAIAELSLEARLRMTGRVISAQEVLYMNGGHDVDGYKHDIFKEACWVTSLCSNPTAPPTTK